MTKYILLHAEDVEKIQAALNKCASDLSSYADMEDQAGYEDGAQALHYSARTAREALALIPAPIEVSEEAEEFAIQMVASIPQQIIIGDGSNGPTLIESISAMITARDEAREERFAKAIIKVLRKNHALDTEEALQVLNAASALIKED